MFSPTKRQAGQGVDIIARKFQILTALHDQRELAKSTGLKDKGLTAGGIAKKCDMARSPHLVKLLEQLYLEGVVVVKVEAYRPNVNRHVWEITDNAYFAAAYHELFNAYLGKLVPDF